MEQGTKHLLFKLLDEKKESYESAIYSLNVSRVSNYELMIARHKKKIVELELAKEDIKGLVDLHEVPPSDSISLAKR